MPPIELLVLLLWMPHVTAWGFCLPVFPSSQSSFRFVIFPLRCKLSHKNLNGNIMSQHIVALINELKINLWYNLMMILSICIFVATAAGLLPNLPTNPTLLASLGIFLICLGERTNHYTETQDIPAGTNNQGIYTRKYKFNVRADTAIGWVFNIIGFSLIVTSIVKFI